MSLFKKKDEDRKEAYKPSDDNVSAKEGSSSGKGGGEPAAPSVDPSTKSGKAAIKKSMDDGRLGYGYIDRNTGVEVPWYIDMINGGGANAAGDTFVSPFAELPFGGGMASMPSNLGNAMNIAPYGYNQPRRYAQAGMQGYPTSAPAPTGGGVSGGSSVTTPNKVPTSTIMPILDANQGGYEQAAFASGRTQPSDPYGIGQGGEMAGVSIPSGLLMNQPARTPPSAMAMPQTVAPSVPQDPAYNAFVESVRNDPMFVGIIDNPEAMRNIYTMYKQQMGM